MDGLHQLKLARGRLSYHCPYFSAALWRIKLVAVPGMADNCPGPIGVSDDWVCYFDPQAIQKFNIEETVGIWCHELYHLLRRHGARASLAGVTPQTMLRWNVAADCEINDDVSKRFTLPPNCTYPHLFSLPEGLSAEEYFQQLPRDPSGSNGTGSGSDGVARPWESRSGGKPHVSQAEAATIAKATAQAVLKAGNVPAELQRWANGVVTVKVDWRRVLTSAVRAAATTLRGKQDYSYRWRSRRQSLEAGAPLVPSMVAYEPKVAVVQDTSQSMGADEIGECLAHIDKILQSLQARQVMHYSVDAAVHTASRIGSAKRAKLVGGGGTDMTPGLKAAAESRFRPDVVIVLTDGHVYGGWPADCPPFRTIIVLVGKHHASPEACPKWAKVIEVTP